VTFHYKLIELESERVAKEQSRQGFSDLPVECFVLMQYVEREVGVRLADLVPKDWQGWLSYQRNKQALVICRGRAFKESTFGKVRAGLNVPNGLDSINETQRGFDISPPQDIDHLLINFGGETEDPRVFLWYGENFAPYKLIYMAQVDTDPHTELDEAIVEACTWIMKRPKDKPLSQFLQERK